MTETKTLHRLTVRMLKEDFQLLQRASVKDQRTINSFVNKAIKDKTKEVLNDDEWIKNQ